MIKRFIEKLRNKRKTLWYCAGYLLLLGIVCFYEFYWKDSNYIIGIPQVLILIVFILAISCIVSIKCDKINELPSISSKTAIFMSAVIFLVYRIVFLVKHKGFFSFDEFYHISTLNPDYVTNYDRAPYINGMVKILCNILGQSDLIVKLVPFILGSISFGCALYLLYNIYDNSYWMIIVSLILIFMPYIANNHFYIRMYVFLEAVFMIDCVLFYKAVKKGEHGGKVNIALAIILTALYALNTNDSSSKVLLVVMITAGSYYFLEKDMVSLFNKYTVIKVGAIAVFISCLIVIIYLIAVKQHWIESSLLESEMVIKVLGTNLEIFYHANSPVFLEFIFIRNFYISIPLLLSLFCTFRDNNDGNKILFIISGLPLLGYMILLYNSYLLRTYMAFFSVLCILAYVVFNKLRLSNLQYWAVLVGVLVLSLSGTKEFWKTPGINHETAACNLGEAMETARNLEEQGYEIISLMSYKTQSAYFDLLDIELNLNREDLREELMHKELLTSDDAGIKVNTCIRNELEKIFASDIRRVIVADHIGMKFLGSMKQDVLKGRNIEIRQVEGNAGVAIVN